MHIDYFPLQEWLCCCPWQFLWILYLNWCPSPVMQSLWLVTSITMIKPILILKLSNDAGTYFNFIQVMEPRKLNEHRKEEFPCSLCDSTFSIQASLTTHIKSIHRGVKHPCTHCDYKATQVSSLNVHVKSKHLGITYTCDVCEVVLKSK